MALWKKLIDGFRQWLELPLRWKLMTLEIWCGLLIVSLLLRSPWHQFVMRERPLKTRHREIVETPGAVVDLVNGVATRHVKPMTCLERAIVARIVLRRRGVDVDLRIGVNRMAGETEAHAWLEFMGQPLDDRAATFVTLKDLNA